MKRDLRINFGVLEDVRDSLYQFMRALEEMKSSVQLIDKELANGSGKSVEAIREGKSEVVKAIDTYKEQVNDVYVLISDYVMDMGRYIRPQAIGAVMQVDRNDIWMNLGQIEGTNYISVMKPYVNTSSNVSTCDAFTNAYTTTTEPSVSGQHNQRIVDQIEDDVHYIVARIKNEIQDLWDIYNQRIVPFENTDDDYKARSERLYDHYTSWQERASDIFNTASQGVVGFLVGVWDGIVGIVSGLWSMAVNVSCYTISGIVYLVTAPFGSTPQEVLDYLDGTNETIGRILNDPCLIFEGMGQNISDTYEEKGIMYSIGAVVPDIALDILVTKGLGKLGKAGKAGDVAENVADVGKYADELSNSLMVPQGLSGKQFTEMSTLLKNKLNEISDDIFVQGSRAGGTAKATSDIDIGVRVSQQQFDELIKRYFGTPNPGSAKERTMLHAIETGKIQAGEAKLTGLRKELERLLEMEVDISIILEGGKFDNPPHLPIE